MKKKTKTQTSRTITKSNPSTGDPKKPLGDHFGELRSRLYKCALSIVAFSAVGYFIQQQLVAILLKPAKGQQFIYTSPLGGLNFLFQVCIYFGIAISIPVIIYQLLRFIEPVILQRTKHLISRYSFYSVLLAVLGASFGYFVGLPITLGFLGRQFTTTQIKPLLTIQEYMSFVALYLLGAALLFQLPLIITFIDRIRPLSPKNLMKFQRYMILIAFVAAAIMTPTTDIIDQLMFAVPMMLMYETAVAVIFLKRRRDRPVETTQSAPDDPPAAVLKPSSDVETDPPMMRYWDIVVPAKPDNKKPLPRLRAA